MVKRILLSLLSMVVLLLSACQLPASTPVSIESSTNPPSETDNNPTPTLSSTPNNTILSAPDISDEHAQAFYEYASSSIETGRSWDLIMTSVDNNIPGSYTDLYNTLARDYITGSLLYSKLQYPRFPDLKSEILDYFKNKHPDQLDGVTQFINSVEARPDNANLVQEAVQEYGLYADAPVPTVKPSAFDGNADYTYNPTDGTNQSALNIPLNSLSGDIPYPLNGQYSIRVVGSLIDPNQLVAQPVDELEVTGSPEVGAYNLKLNVKGAVEWANVLILDKDNNVVGYYLAANRRLGVPHLMAMRSLPQDEQGKAMLPWWVYHPDGTTEPASEDTPTFPPPSDQLEAALTKAVDAGDITEAEKQTLLAQFDVEELKQLIRDDYMRAGFILAETLKDTGGDLIFPALTGENAHNSPITFYVNGDPEIDAIYQSHNLPRDPINADSGSVVGFPDGTTIFILGEKMANGQEPIEVLASLMSHEILVHDQPLHDSMTEETVGNIVQALAWIRTGQRDPSLFSRNTIYTKLNNLLAYVLLNSLYVDTDQPSPFISQIGLLSTVTGPQTHDQADYNAWSGSVRRHIKGFPELIQGLYANVGGDNPGPDLEPVSLGTENTRLLFNIMFPDLVIQGGEGHTGPNGEKIPDFSPGLIDRLDPLMHNLIPNDQFPQLAQALHITLDGSNVTP